MAAIAACLLLSTASGQADFLEGGYVASGDRSMADPGISGMLQWLDRPVNLPWYSSDSSFYKRAAPATTFTPYKEYYTALGSAAGTAAGSGIISNPARYDIAGRDQLDPVCDMPHRNLVAAHRPRPGCGNRRLL